MMASSKAQSTNTKTPSGKVSKSSVRDRTPTEKTSSTGGGEGSSVVSRPLKKPSDRLNPKTIDPFKDSKSPKSTFASVYAKGGVPCRLVHGSVKHKLHWDSNPNDFNFDPLLITLAEGLQESKHPYQFVAQRGFKELLQVPDANAKATAVLQRIIGPLRAALGSTNDAVFEGAIDALVQLCVAVGPQMNQHLKSVLSYLSKNLMNKKFRDPINSALQQIEGACGKDSQAIIKAKIPTYSSVL